jgi:glycosyltransferase involved in cell wall biosynthesis
MEICFCLPNPSLKPVGGYKIVFEYANRLSERGHKVSIVFGSKSMLKKNKAIPEYFRRVICYFIVKGTPRWFKLNADIRKFYAYNILDSTVPDGDLIISTAIETVEDVNNLCDKKGRKVSFIQDFENWSMSDTEVFKTYQLKINKIVISKWLQKIVDSKSPIPSTYIPNGLDFNILKIDIPIQQRRPYTIAMLYHKQKRKGVKYGLEVVYKLKKQYPALEVKMFGAPERPHYLPDWIHYTRKANQEQLRSIYNDSAIFLSSSIQEGFGLTGAEAMACGCALISTSHQGVHEYAENEINALISPVKDVDALFNNVVRLFSDDKLRNKIATKGAGDIRKLNWENSLDLFENTLNKINKISDL